MISGHVVVINNVDLSGGDIFLVPKLPCEPRGSPSQKEFLVIFVLKIAMSMKLQPAGISSHNAKILRF
jgi:hypothetical protein